MGREYMVVKVPNDNIALALDVCIGYKDSQRWNNTKDKVVVKTNEGLINHKVEKGIRRDKIFPKGLTTYYTYDELLVELQKPEWN